MTGTSTVLTRDDVAGVARRVIHDLAGANAEPRADQLAAVEALLVDRGRALVVQATGWGKSAVYWIAARAMREAGGGPTVVVSPLLALIRDQIGAAARAGIQAATMNSANFEDWAAVTAKLKRDEVDVLLISPERLSNPRFETELLPDLVARMSLLVIDEAHCISSWGHDFRPDYQRIMRVLVARPQLPVLATTATANARVTADVAAQLGADTTVLRGPLARTSLRLGVTPRMSAVDRYAWVDDALRVLPGSGIVYVLTVADAERLAEHLRDRGHDVAAYTGRLDAAARSVVEQRLRDNAVKAVVATSALGMGYDKPDLAFCIHVGSPASPVDYYQQVGRAGRTLESAVAMLLPSSSDAAIWDYFATANTPDPALAARVLDALADGPAMTVPALEALTSGRRGRLEMLLKVLAVDGAVRRTADGWVATGEPWRFDTERYAALAGARAAEADLMRGYASRAGCLMTFLRRALDDDVADAEACGTCSVCTGALPAGLRDRPSADSVDAATTWARKRDVVVEPRAMWASGMQTRRGRIGVNLNAAPGRALAFADDPGWSAIVEPITGGDAPDQPVPPQVAEALVTVLSRWSAVWGPRPTAVVPVPSRGRPQLVGSIAMHIAEVGRLPLIRGLEPVGPRPPADVAASARARAVEASLRLADGLALPSGPLLLVDDSYRTGWTVTVAAALLRDAGATAVLPLVLHQRP
ncbi:MAG: RecQ family ATP-dependent DNA helicase [Candidatus Nanopelagicales bacterium]